MVLDMLQDLAVGITNLYKGFRVGKLFGSLRQTFLDRQREAVTEFAQPFWSIQGLSLNDVKRIDPRSKCVSEPLCVHRRSDRRRREIRRVQDVSKTQISSRGRLHLGAHC